MIASAASRPDRPLLFPLALALLATLLAEGVTPARAEFRMQNGAIAACAGVHTDSGGPAGAYGNDEFYLQTIWPGEQDRRVMLDFSSFVSEAGYDTLIIYNGHNNQAPVLAEVSGSTTGTIRSTALDGSLTLLWMSDGSGVSSGWTADISCLPAEQVIRNASAYACDGVFTDSGGLSDPYQSFETYLQIVYPTHAGDRLEATFTAFDTEGSFDPLYVYDGTTTSDPLLGVFSGSALPPTLRATNPSGALTFRFLSDGSTVGAGWRAVLNCAHRIESLVTPAVRTCSGTIVDSGGSGGSYGNGEYFLQTLLPEDPTAKLELAFSEFATEAVWDVLTVYDGDTTGAPVLGTFSGSTSPGLLTSTAANGALTLTWSSDGSNVAAGWAANVACVHPISSIFVSTCSAISTDTGGRAAPYANSESVVQTFQSGRPWSLMRAIVFNFASEDGTDLLRVRDGGAGAPILGTLTGSPSLPVAWVAPNLAQRLTLDWSSNASGIGAGWNALVRCELPVFADGFEGRDLAQWSLAIPGR